MLEKRFFKLLAAFSVRLWLQSSKIYKNNNHTFFSLCDPWKMSEHEDEHKLVHVKYMFDPYIFTCYSFCFLSLYTAYTGARFRALSAHVHCTLRVAG